jgi:hypothetical protein
MSIATTTALAIGGLAIGAAGGIAAGVGASGQADAANNAANLQASAADKSIAEQRREFDINQRNQAPFLATGQDAARQLREGLQPGGSLVEPWKNSFTAPTAATEQNDPGYQFRLQQGQQMLENSAASRGSLLDGNTAMAEQQYGQDYASNEYSKVYERALGQYQQQYNIFQNNQANLFNRLSAASGGGQIAANQLGQLGQTSAANIGSINMNSAERIGQQMNNAAAARASGYVGGFNSIGSALNGVTQAQMLQQLLGNQNPTYKPVNISQQDQTLQTVGP